MKFTSINPATGATIWEGNESSPAEIDQTLGTARKAFESWSLLPIEERIAHLNAFSEELKGSSLAETISLETGKPLWESKGEVSAMLGKIPISVEAYKERCPDREKPHPTARSITTHRPHGVVAVFGPFNFPGHLPNGHIVPALLAGNTVILKASELTPRTAEEMVALWHASGLPQGVLQLVQGGPAVGKLLAYHPELDGLFFTGSWPIGKEISEHYGSHPGKILALEMGGNNPLIIGNISDAKAAAYQTIQSAYLTAGQRCTCARRLIVVNNRPFIDEVSALLKGITVGPYTDAPEPFMGPVISNYAAESLLSEQNRLLTHGAQPIHLMDRPHTDLPFLTPGLIDVTHMNERSDGECFGPLLQVIHVPNLSDALIEANNTKYGLSAGIFSDDPEEYALFSRKIRAGVVNWNTPLTGASSAAPFGGVGHSGNHRPSAYYAADYCSYPVASLLNERLSLPEKPIPGLSL